jgi:hypothetical protein
MEKIGLEWWILYVEIFALTCIMGYWLGDCFGKIIQAIKGSDEIIRYLQAIYESMERG